MYFWKKKKKNITTLHHNTTTYYFWGGEIWCRLLFAVWTPHVSSAASHPLRRHWSQRRAECDGMCVQPQWPNRITLQILLPQWNHCQTRLLGEHLRLQGSNLHLWDRGVWRPRPCFSKRLLYGFWFLGTGSLLGLDISINWLRCAICNIHLLQETKQTRRHALPAEPMECDVSENVSVRSLRILRFLLFISRSNGDGKCYNAKVETKDPYTNR